MKPPGGRPQCPPGRACRLLQGAHRVSRLGFGLPGAGNLYKLSAIAADALRAALETSQCPMH